MGDYRIPVQPSLTSTVGSALNSYLEGQWIEASSGFVSEIVYQDVTTMGDAMVGRTETTSLLTLKAII